MKKVNDSLAPGSSKPPRKVHAEDSEKLVRCYWEYLTEQEREVALETARGTPLKQMGMALNSGNTAGSYGRVRNEIAKKITWYCPDLAGRPEHKMEALIRTIWPHSTDDPPRRPK